MEYKLEKSYPKDISILVDYKLRNIFDYANHLTEDEMSRIIDYVKKMVPKQLDNYRNITRGSRIIGCLLVFEENDYYVLDEIYIESQYRNQGIGTDIIKGILKEHPYVKLCVYKKNRRAYALYESLGFQIEYEKDERYHMVNKIEEKPKTKTTKKEKKGEKNDKKSN